MTERSPVVLLLVDVINDLQFPGSAALVGEAVTMARRIAVLKRRARRAGVAVIYVNDNFGKWRSDFRRLVAHCVGTSVPGRPIARLLKPSARDYFVLKPHQSGFYATTLETLLRHLDAHTVIVTGIAGNRCVLFTAQDAYMRDLRVVVPADCTVSESRRDNQRALEHMRDVLKADITPSAQLDLVRLKRRPRAVTSAAVGETRSR
jgi:nicotinamidase-related amidase